MLTPHAKRRGIIMRCLYCNKELDENNIGGWHKKCIKKFFDIDTMPELDISDDMLSEIASKNIRKGITVPGVQKKISVHLSKADKYRLTIVGYPTGYILKPNSDEFAGLPEAEHLCMHMADIVGIKTVKNGLVKIENGYAYITKRVDRNINILGKDKGSFEMLAMEDFCQLSNKLTQDKYKGSYEQCAKIIDRYSSQPGIDMTEFYLRLIFCFIIGNSDMHLKNFSLIEKKAGNREFVLSPAYDLLPVNVVLPEDDEETALMLCGRKKNIKRKHFLELADKINIQKNVAERLIDKVISKVDTFIEMCDNSIVPQDIKEGMKELIIKRTKIIN